MEQEKNQKAATIRKVVIGALIGFALFLVQRKSYFL
jgi:hypothetical protein